MLFISFENNNHSMKTLYVREKTDFREDRQRSLNVIVANSQIVYYLLSCNNTLYNWGSSLGHTEENLF